MKSNQKMTLLFWHRKSQANGMLMAPIYCRITIETSEVEWSTGLRIPVDCWDLHSKKAFRCPEAKSVNKILAQVETDLNRHYMLLQLHHEVVTPIMLKNVYEGKPADAPKGFKHSRTEATLVQLFSHQISNFQKQVARDLRSSETLKQWRATRNKIPAFLQSCFGKQDIALKEIKPNFGDRFYHYLTIESKETLGELTARGQLKKLKQVVKLAVTEGHLNSNPLQDLKCSGGEKEIIPLEYSQVLGMWHKKIEIPRLEQVRDAFVFQCFTGFAYQDIRALSPKNIMTVGVNGERWLSKDRGKSEVYETVPILPVVEQLIRKYSSHHYCVTKNRLIPILSNAKYNGYLKELSAICGIERDIHTHLARHTFADFMLNILGFPLEDVSKMMGHKNIRTTQRYVKVRRIKISEHLNRSLGIIFTPEGQLRSVA